jgi:hypothetical protein
LGIPPLRDEPRPFQDAEVLGDSGHTHFEWLGKFADRTFIREQAGQDGSAGGVRKRCEGDAQSVGGHVFN